MRRCNPSLLQLNRRQFLKIAATIPLTAWLSGLNGCTSAGPIRIASYVWPGYEFMFLARNMGWLQPEDAVLVETSNASESLEHLLTGKVQGAALTLDETLRAIQQGVSLSVVLLFDVSSGADALMVKSHIKSLSQLKGARIGVEASTVGALMLKKLMTKAGLVATDIEIVNINTDSHLTSWQSKQLDALITYEPTAIKIEQLGAVRLFDSREIPNTIFDVLAVRREAAESYKPQLQALISSHFKAQQVWKTNPIDTAYRLSKRLDTRAEDIPLLYRGLELPDLVYNHHLLGGQAGELNTLLQEISAFIDMNPNLIPADLFTAAYLPKS